MFANDTSSPRRSVVGPLAIGVPGSVAGLAALQERFGTMSLRDVIAPALRLAEQGFVVDSQLAASLARFQPLIARFEGRALTVSSAGMPPVLVHRRDANSVQEIAIGATPLGTLGITYEDRAVELAAGDTVLFMTDGFPELMNHTGQQLGYAVALDAFADAARAVTASAVIESLAAFAARWHGETAPNDDVTFVVVRMR